MMINSSNTKINISLFALSLSLAFAAAFFACWESLVYLAEQWSNREEYSHGMMIPFIAIYLLLLKKDTILAAPWRGSILYLPFMLIGFFMILLGELSGIFEIIQYGFIVLIASIFIAVWGFNLTLFCWAAFTYLIFMVPLPNFLHVKLSSGLQLISSEIGVAILRLVDVSVYQEGNVIDLGVYQLQVVEACSGLRYLFPLMSFGFLINCLYKAGPVQKTFLFLSTIPITIIMNSFRIAVIGVTVDLWGIEMAEGILHDFEGWVVFMACLLILSFEMYIIHRFSSYEGSFLDRLEIPVLNFEKAEKAVLLESAKQSLTPLFTCIIVTISLSFLVETISERPPVELERKMFSDFPLVQNDWVGKQSSLDRKTLDELDLTDYFIANYSSSGEAPPVNFYIAWYAVQTKGESIHSPSTCLPGGGWKIKNHVIETLNTVQRDGIPLKVNRVNMQMGDSNQLVYYWFEGRDRNITNEYLGKWFVFWDALTKQRTDGALVRLVTYVPEYEDINKADQRLTKFIGDFYSELPAYVPN